MTQAQVTTLSKANDRSDSLRTTVPAIIVKLFNLKEKGRIEWLFDVEKGKITVSIRPLAGKRK